MGGGSIAPSHFNLLHYAAIIMLEIFSHPLSARSRGVWEAWLAMFGNGAATLTTPISTCAPRRAANDFCPRVRLVGGVQHRIPI